MAKKKVEVLYFKIRPETDKEQMTLDIYHLIKTKRSFTKQWVMENSNAGEDVITYYLDLCVKKRFLIKEVEAGEEKYEFNTDHGKVLGLGFRNGRCYLTLMNLAGEIVQKDNIAIDLLIKGKGRNKDISGIVQKIAEVTNIDKQGILYVGMGIPEEMVAANPKSASILSRGLTDIFRTEVYSTSSATAAGYGDRDNSPVAAGKNILYMYSDVGIGVILKRESIFEADEYSEDKYGAYLKPWNQYSIVNTTKDLVSRGVGTEIVKIVEGDIDSITMPVVLKAAKDKDELAEDLVKRSGLALGVRVAYLVNMFNVEYVLFGGGIELDEGGFIDCVKESMVKFLPKETSDGLKIVRGVLKDESSSVGAAALCRREIFMEV